MISQITPALIALSGFDDVYDDLKKVLTFKDTSVKHEIDRHKKAYWFINKFGREAYDQKLEALKATEHRCLLTEQGSKLVTYSGLRSLIEDTFPSLSKEFKWETEEVPPPKDNIPWANKFHYPLRDYQLIAIERLLANRHAGVSLPTGSGKSAIILHLAKKLALKTVIMAPSVSIAKQLYDLFIEHLGGKYVGLFGGGKKQLNKLFTIGIAQSLTRIEEGSKEWEAFSDTKVFIADESHLCPATTLEKVCLGVLGMASYRFFFSATQMRNDGSALLLDGITGPIVYTLSTQDLIEKGYLAKPNFLVVRTESKSKYDSKDMLRMLTYHLYNNAPLHKKVAEMANQSVELLNHKVLIMIDKVEQFKYLFPYLKHKVEFAHGGNLATDNRDGIPEKFFKSDPNDLVDQFNKGEIPILIGTPCIAVGTDIKPVDVIYNLQGGKSEIKFKQLIGRGTRTTETKTQFWFVDFMIDNIPALKNHTFSRVKIYRDFYDSVKFIG
jgi:superfamily II DNA or RNA helicase